MIVSLCNRLRRSLLPQVRFFDSKGYSSLLITIPVDKTLLPKTASLEERAKIANSVGVLAAIAAQQAINNTIKVDWSKRLKT